MLISLLEYEDKQNDETSATRYFCYQWLIFVRQLRNSNQGIQLCAEDIFDTVDCKTDDCPLSFDCKLSKCNVELEARQGKGYFFRIKKGTPWFENNFLKRVNFLHRYYSHAEHF